MVSPGLTASGRVKRYKTWQSALEHAMIGVDYLRRYDVMPTERRAEGFASAEPEGAFSLLLELANGYYEHGAPDEAQHIMRLSDDMAGWLEWRNNGGDALPWDEPEEVKQVDNAHGMPDEVAQAFEVVSKWADDNGYRARITKPRNLRGKRQEVPTLEPDAIQAILSAIDSRSTTQVRSRAMVALLAATGLRIGELLALRVSSLDMSEPDVWWVHVPCEDGCKSGARSVPFSATGMVRKELTRWLERRFPVGEHLFNTSSGEPLTYQGFRRSLTTYGERAGIKVKPHMFRHTYATRMAQEGVDMATISVLLGHSSPKVTADYYLHADRRRLVEVVKRYGV